MFVSIEWDNWSNKTIVNNNTLPPLPLQSSKLSSSGEMHFHVETMCLFISNSLKMCLNNVPFHIKNNNLGRTNIHGLKP